MDLADDRIPSPCGPCVAWGRRQFGHLTLMALVASLLIIVGLCAVGNQPQVFTDYVIEYTAADGANKTGEIQVVRVAALICMVLLVAWDLLIKDKPRRGGQSGKPFDYRLVIPIGVLTYFLVQLLFFGSLSSVMLGGVLVIIILFMCNRERLVDAVVLYFLVTYGLLGLYRLIIFLNVPIRADVLLVWLLLPACSFSVTVCLTLLSRRTESLGRCALIFMCLMPFVLLALSADRYELHGEQLRAGIPLPAFATVALITLVCIAFTTRRLTVMWEHAVSANGITGLIGPATIFLILAANQMTARGTVFPSDFHHPGENIISFPQIVALGQTPYESYTPVSGLHGLVEGGILYVLCQGQMTCYYLAENFHLLASLAITAYLLCKQFDSAFCFVSALVYTLGTYNRYYWILPLILLLSLRTLTKQPAIWLLVWLTTSLLCGLYYPIAGTSVCIGFVPLAIAQARRLLTVGSMHAYILSPVVIAGSITALILLFFCAPTLVGMLSHTLALASQTHLADGISAFASMAPDDFLPLLAGGKTEAIRQATYMTMRFSVPVALLLLAASLIVAPVKRFGTAKHAMTSASMSDTLRLVVPAALCLMVTSAYTTVRMDVGVVFARQTTIVIIVAIVLSLHMLANVQKTMYGFVVAVALIAIPATCSLDITPIGISPTLFASHIVLPDDYTELSEELAATMGSGFASEDASTRVSHDVELAATLPAGTPTFAIGNFVDQYVTGLPGVSAIESSTVKGFDATQECVQMLTKTAAIVGTDLSPICSYYLYNWILTSGNYVWSDEMHLFKPSKGEPLSSVLEKNKSADLCPYTTKLGKISSSLGSSLESLLPILNDPAIRYETQTQGASVEVSFEEGNGDRADFLYVAFDQVNREPQHTLMQFDHTFYRAPESMPDCLTKSEYNGGVSVIVTWQGKDNILCRAKADLSQGRLLIPLGACRDWLLNDHDSLSIRVQDERGNKYPPPNIAELRFLKLREVG